jgi:hypothetical protein
MTKATCLGSAVVAEIAVLEGRKKVLSKFPNHELKTLFLL